MQTFHHRLMALLDEAQKSGATVSPLHAAIRRALREANMKGRQFSSVEDLAHAVAKFSPARRAEVLKVAA